MYVLRGWAKIRRCKNSSCGYIFENILYTLEHLLTDQILCKSFSSSFRCLNNLFVGFTTSSYQTFLHMISNMVWILFVPLLKVHHRTLFNQSSQSIQHRWLQGFRDSHFLIRALFAIEDFSFQSNLAVLAAERFLVRFVQQFLYWGLYSLFAITKGQNSSVLLLASLLQRSPSFVNSSCSVISSSSLFHIHSWFE